MARFTFKHRLAANPYWRTALAMSSSVSAGALALLILLLASSRGDFVSIGAYGAGAGVLTVASGLLSGGTTLAYTTGDLQTQSVVRALRAWIVTPLMVITTAITVSIFSASSELPLVEVLWGCSAVVLTNYTEVDLAWHRRKLHGMRMLGIETIGRVAGLAAIAFGMSFATSMMLGQLVRTLVYGISAASDESRSAMSLKVLAGWRKAYQGGLTALSLLYALNDRLPVIIGPVIFRPDRAGQFTALTNVQQSLASVGMAGLQTTLATRSEERTISSWSKKVVKLIVIAYFLAMAVGIAFEPRIAELMNVSGLPQSRYIWYALMLTLPLAILTRALDFRLITEGRTKLAATGRTSATVVLLLGALLAYNYDALVFLAIAIPAGEFSTLLVCTICWRVIRRRVSSPARTGRARI